jgi:formylglycine-generating enzyme required for sulfatase activity
MRAFSLLLMFGVLACNGHDTDSGAQPTASVTVIDGVPTSSAPEPSASATGSASASPTLHRPTSPPPPDPWGESTRWAGTLPEQNDYMFEQMQWAHGYTDAQMAGVREAFAGSEFISQGNPYVTDHPMTVAECHRRVEQAHVDYDNAELEQICGARWMAPLYRPASQKATDARVCIDLFEFPDIPCAYPVTMARPGEVVNICKALGKRMCDAHEWEGACQGDLTPAEENYNFDLVRYLKPEDGVKSMRGWHNSRVIGDKRWSYGPEYKEGICATSGSKSRNCTTGGWSKCGANTFPAGSFPGCVSPLGVFDLNGNAAEHMNLPLKAEQMSTDPSQVYGHTEMKGSWFVFDQIRAHEDYCRWRAPYWHGSRIQSGEQHRNYHLGFRCCKDVPGD